MRILSRRHGPMFMPAQRPILVVLPLLLTLSCASRVPPESRRQAHRLYQEGLELFRQDEVESAVLGLEQAIRLDPGYAAAHDLLGQIYLRRGDIRARWLATKRALRAVALAPDEAEYRYHLAMVYRERGFDHSAAGQLKNILKRDPRFWKAHYELGLLWEESGLRYESQERHRRAVTSLMQAAEIAPEEYWVLYHLGFNLAEVSQWAAAAEQLEAAVEINPQRHEAHLLLGVAHQQLGKLEESEGSYQSALERMTEEERIPFQSLEYLARPEELEFKESADREEMIRRFWKERDPTPTTRVNERRLEHYRRVAHANMHFAASKLDMPGWRTKRGEFYIRYGEPAVKWRELGEVQMGVGLVPPRWIWSYGQEGREVSLIFADTFLNGEYNFPFPDKTWGAADFRDSPATVAQRMVLAQPEVYQHDYGGEPLAFAYRTVEFRGQQGMTDLEVIYGIPNPNLTFSRSGQMARADIERHAVLFDTLWNEVARSGDRQIIQVSPTQTSNPNRMVVEKANFQVPSGVYWLALNIRDRESGDVGIVKAQVAVSPYDRRTLALSSLVLANELVSTHEAERFRRGDRVVVPRLSRYFQASQPLLVYYEVYNLSVDAWGETWYQTEYTIERLASKKGFLSRTLSVIASPFRSGRRWESVSSTLESRGTSPGEVGQLQVDMFGAAQGDYLLRLMVTDMNSGQRAERETEFTLVE